MRAFATSLLLGISACDDGRNDSGSDFLARAAARAEARAPAPAAAPKINTAPPAPYDAEEARIAAHRAALAAEAARPKTKEELAERAKEEADAHKALAAQAKAAAKQAVKDRKGMAELMETFLRNDGANARVRTRGKDHSIVVIRWEGCDAAWLDAVTDVSSLMDTLREVGVTQVDCDDGTEVWQQPI
jgi:hypothetical protein